MCVQRTGSDAGLLPDLGGLIALAIAAVFVDRDGTLGGTGHFIHPRDFQLYPGSDEALRRLQRAGIKVFAFTNQHRISRGEVAIDAFEQEFRAMGLDGWYICPHEIGGDCDCQKPKPGLLQKAAKDHGIDLAQCAVIGDVGTDMLAAAAVGATKILVLTGWGKGSLSDYRHVWSSIEPDYIAENLASAVDWLLCQAEIGASNALSSDC